MKRSIGHLCHDEPRESTRGQKAEKENGSGHNEAMLKQEVLQPNLLGPSLDQQRTQQQFMQDAEQAVPQGAMAPQSLRPTSNPLGQGGGYGNTNQQCMSRSEL